MPDSVSDEMAKRRALLTDTEREIMVGEKDVKDNYRYSVESRVRTRIRDDLPEDVEALRENYPEIFDELRSAVCDDTSADLRFSPLGEKNISYGPSSRADAAFVLRVGTGDGTVEIHLDEDEMYELWTEVQHTPWPDAAEEHEEIGRLRRELVEKAMGADEQMLEDALDAIDPHRHER